MAMWNQVRVTSLLHTSFHPHITVQEYAKKVKYRPEFFFNRCRGINDPAQNSPRMNPQPLLVHGRCTHARQSQLADRYRFQNTKGAITKLTKPNDIGKTDFSNLSSQFNRNYERFRFKTENSVHADYNSTRFTWRTPAAFYSCKVYQRRIQGEAKVTIHMKNLFPLMTNNLEEQALYGHHYFEYPLQYAHPTPHELITARLTILIQRSSCVSLYGSGLV